MHEFSVFKTLGTAWHERANAHLHRFKLGINRIIISRTKDISTPYGVRIAEVYSVNSHIS